jgi:Uma2 family endonuclease
MPATLERPPAGNDVLWTAEEFLDWLEPGLHADLIDGEISMHSPVSFPHADLLNFLDELLRRWLRASKTGGSLYREVIAVKLSQRNVFLPDLIWFDETQSALLPESHATLPPRWVCEVLSKRTAHRDRGPKFAAYEEHGVREYWILDPKGPDHKFYKTDGEYLREFAVGEPIIRSTEMPGFAVRREWLNPAARHDVDACLAEIPNLPA